MIKKEYKLKTYDVKTVSRTGRLFRSKYFDIRVLDNELFNIGVSVSKKIDKRSVVRNKIKRLIYDSFRELNNEGVVLNNKYFVIVRSVELSNLTINDIKREIVNTIS